MGYDARTASIYEADPEHCLPPEEGCVWLDLMRGLRDGRDPSGRALDIGAGTGLLTAVLKGAGLEVAGLEPSAAMIAQGLAANPNLSARDFVQGRADYRDLFTAGRFDWIVSRQVLCHLSDPATCFRIWRDWLQPGGFMVLVDGFWRREAWGRDALEIQPFASVTDAADVAAVLERAGLRVLRAGGFAGLDAVRRQISETAVPRYVVVAAR